MQTTLGNQMSEISKKIIALKVPQKLHKHLSKEAGLRGLRVGVFVRSFLEHHFNQGRMDAIFEGYDEALEPKKRTRKVQKLQE
jgi:hypothetical protein